MKITISTVSYNIESESRTGTTLVQLSLEAENVLLSGEEDNLEAYEIMEFNDNGNDMGIIRQWSL